MYELLCAGSSFLFTRIGIIKHFCWVYKIYEVLNTKNGLYLLKWAMDKICMTIHSEDIEF